jgi:hypothetical protein
VVCVCAKVVARSVEGTIEMLMDNVFFEYSSTRAPNRAVIEKIVVPWDESED